MKWGQVNDINHLYPDEDRPLCFGNATWATWFLPTEWRGMEQKSWSFCHPTRSKIHTIYCIFLFYDMQKLISEIYFFHVLNCVSYKTMFMVQFRIHLGKSPSTPSLKIYWISKIINVARCKRIQALKYYLYSNSKDFSHYQTTNKQVTYFGITHYFNHPALFLWSYSFIILSFIW